MNVEQYLFQSPSPMRVQVGRPDTSVAKEETDTQAKADESVQTTQETQDLTAKELDKLTASNPNQILDLYV
ncbi:MAG: hypothetical protein H8E76_08810 [Helicobacteraceae bacterium]|nr:hypothetical protein [Candidatus Sulfurimonas ponti]MBL6972786.1 hypothetical protein [Sulfurimonas sp.]